jgi:hypothetical protein
VDRHRTPVVCTALATSWCRLPTASAGEGIAVFGHHPDGGRDSFQGFGHEWLTAGVQTGVIDASRQFHGRAARVASISGITT